MGQARQAGSGILLLTGVAGLLAWAGCAAWSREVLPAVAWAWALALASALPLRLLWAGPPERLVLCWGASVLARLGLLGAAMAFSSSEAVPVVLALSMFVLELVTAAWLAPTAFRRASC